MRKPNICKKQNSAVCLMSLGKVGAPSFLCPETFEWKLESLLSGRVKTVELDYYVPLTHRQQNNLSHLHLFDKVIWRLLLQVSQYSFK